MITRQQREREKQTKFIKRAIIGTSVAGVLMIVLIVAFGSRKKTYELDNNSYADWAVNDSQNYEGALVNGGNTEQLDVLYKAVYDYFDYMKRGNFEYMYDRFWDDDCLKSYGFTFNRDKFIEEQKSKTSQYHLLNEDPKRIDFSYSAVTYDDYTNFYLYTFSLQYTYYDNSGKVVNTPMMQCTYTLIPYQGKDVILYKILDFDLTDVGTQYTRFDVYTGETVQPTTQAPQSSPQQTTNPSQQSTQPTTNGSDKGTQLSPGVYGSGKGGI